MFNLRVTHVDLARETWTWVAGRWRCGSSRIVPYRHPLTEQAALTDGERTALISAIWRSGTARSNPEVTSVTAGEYDKAVTMLGEERDDWVLVETRPGRPVRISTGTACTAPQYLAAADGVLDGSWDLSNLRDHRRPDRLDLLAVTRHLALRTLSFRRTREEPRADLKIDVVTDGTWRTPAWRTPADTGDIRKPSAFLRVSSRPEHRQASPRCHGSTSAGWRRSSVRTVRSASPDGPVSAS